jgi:hypothetical protein
LSDTSICLVGILLLSLACVPVCRNAYCLSDTSICLWDYYCSAWPHKLSVGTQIPCLICLSVVHYCSYCPDNLSVGMQTLCLIHPSVCAKYYCSAWHACLSVGTQIPCLIHLSVYGNTTAQLTLTTRLWERKSLARHICLSVCGNAFCDY